MGRLSRWALNAITVPYRREAEEDLMHTEEKVM